MKIKLERVLKKQLAGLLVDLMDGEIDAPEQAISLLRYLANEIERSNK